MNNIEYALETMDEGVLILSKNGTVTYSNPQARSIFEISDGQSCLFRNIIADAGGKNDEIIDLVIEIISSGKLQKSRFIRYTNREGSTFRLLMSCSKMDSGEFVFTFSDQTALVEEGQKRIDSTYVLTSFFIIACLWTVGVSVWMQTGRVFDVGYLTIVMEALATVNLVILLHSTSFKLKDLGLSTNNLLPTLKLTALRLVALLAVFCAAKAAVMFFKPDFFPAGVSFWDWKQADFRLVKYLLTALLQEFLSRGGIQESLSRVFGGKWGKHFAIFLTSLFFMALHFQHGLPMMFGSGALSVLLGYMYKKDGNIYGVTLVHYCFGKFADFLHFL